MKWGYNWDLGPFETWYAFGFRETYDRMKADGIDIPANVQFVAAVNRGSQLSATFGIDAAQLDRFAPLQMTYLPPEEEVKLLQRRHEDLPVGVIEHCVAVADAVRNSEDLPASLSVRATEEACIYMKHPLFAGDVSTLPEVLKSSFCGRFSGRWDDVGSDAGAVWAMVKKVLRERKLSVAEEGGS